MRRRGTARFLKALMASYVLYDLSFLRSLELGHDTFGGWGLFSRLSSFSGSVWRSSSPAISDDTVALGRLLQTSGRHGPLPGGLTSRSCGGRRRGVPVGGGDTVRGHLPEGTDISAIELTIRDGQRMVSVRTLTPGHVIGRGGGRRLTRCGLRTTSGSVSLICSSISSKPVARAPLRKHYKRPTRQRSSPVRRPSSPLRMSTR